MVRVQTRAQSDLKRAVEAIRPLQNSSKELKKNYLSRAKQFPALIMTVGLAQALAFSAEKATKSGELAQAHRHLLNHIYAVLKPEADRPPVDVQSGTGTDVVVNLVCGEQTTSAEYMHMTRRVLAAWVYYRRFAQSLLDPDGELQEQADIE